ncbi:MULTISPECIES: glucosaminidase domain-containing protein [Clostridium]|uniref:glucosaminidase domain-containing protein n=1 Tax=Clostridium TaxID=1485 RepID=UPI0008246831|nr:MULTISPECIES: glucosaminidase domain-containing protein [Clostridium]PJI07460.1 hypothetical protein CUB90_06110 [Clostridium sp. CT7]
MESFVKELENTEVLSIKDIIKIKSYIYKKYTNFSNAQKAKILSNTVHQVLDKNIKGLSTEHSNAIEKNLLKSLIVDKKASIKLSDIFNTYISFKDNSTDYSESLLNWLNLHTKCEISKAQLEETFNLNFTEEASVITSPSQEVTDYNDMTHAAPSSKNFKLISILLSLCLVVISSACFIKFKTSTNSSSLGNAKSKNISAQIKSTKYSKKEELNLPNEFKYREINSEATKKYLNSKNSLLASEPYFSKIINACKDRNLNPLVLFAIAGQEQAFVPKDNPDSKKIANNPFNVYHSWKEYNTNIEDSSKIAAKTVISLCSNLPKDKEPFHWINKNYAEDKNWADGVQSIFNQLQKIN